VLTLRISVIFKCKLKCITYLDPFFLDDILGFCVIIKVHRLPVSGGVIIVIGTKETRPKTTSANTGVTVFVFISVVATKVGSKKAESTDMYIPDRVIQVGGAREG
jgi:hypothetical protein